MGWQMEAGPPTAGRNGLSVVTTVWGMTPGTQTPAARHPGASYENMTMYQRGPAAHPTQVRAGSPSTGYPSQHAAYYRTSSMPAGHGYAPIHLFLQVTRYTIFPIIYYS